MLHALGRTAFPRFRRTSLSKLCSSFRKPLYGDSGQLDMSARRPIMVVLDDDPTGCQTVYGINVLLDFSVSSICKQLEKRDDLFYILTNTRALPETEAEKVTEIALKNLDTADQMVGHDRRFQILSRSDSTLRGHFPAETNAVLNHYVSYFRGVVICPAFFAGGRVTIDDVHYVREGSQLIPAGDTPFAKDPHFGFRSSNLRDWVIEKTKGATPKEWILSVSLADLRSKDTSATVNKLLSAPMESVVIVNAEEQSDLESFASILESVEKQGVPFLLRCAASLVQACAKLPTRPLVDCSQSVSNRTTGGLIVVGSYVPKTTSQLSKLLEVCAITSVEVPALKIIEALRRLRLTDPVLAADPDKALQSQALAEIWTPILRMVQETIQSGEDCVLFTSREFVTGATLADTAVVSRCLTTIVQGLSTAPSFVISKGGITSHEVAQLGLGMKSAHVLGQIEPGVPIWAADSESKYPDLQYIVFPGNVGDEFALSRVAKRLGVRLKTEWDTRKFTAKSQLMLKRLRDLGRQQRAMAAFNVYNLEGAKAAVAAAEQLQQPIILQVHPSSLRFGGRPLLMMLKTFAEDASVDVFIQLDHCEDDEVLRWVLDKCRGVFDSVMLDGSARSFEDNMRWTARWADEFHEAGMLVEAELGRLAGEEDGLSVDARDSKLTDPAQAKEFVAATRVDLLAVTIGNVHGVYALPPNLDFARLESIRQQVQCPISGAPGPVLVLHGASGLSESWVRGAIDRGVAKLNVNTDLRSAALGYYRKQLDPGAAQKADLLPLMRGATQEMTAVATEKIRMFTSDVQLRKF